jgi:probable F420-dependent oxidoreductase
MRIGVVFPQNEIGSDPDDVRAFAQTADELGYAHLLVHDHVLGAVHGDRSRAITRPYTHLTPFHEVLVLLGFLAGVTSSIELTTGVLVLPQRQTALVAKQTAEVDILSRGRLRLGIGIGWNHVEYEALSEEFSTRGRRQEEQIEVLRLLWEQPVVDYTGQWHRIDRAAILPRPARPIPIWLGGYSDAALRRAARLADGYIFGPRSQPTELIPALSTYLIDAGRDPSNFGFDVPLPLNGTHPRWRRDAARLSAAGATALTVSTMGRGLSPVGHIDALGEIYQALSQ